MPMYNSFECSNNYSKTPGSLWQYCKDIPAVDDDGDIGFDGTNGTDSPNFKARINSQIGSDRRIKNVK